MGFLIVIVIVGTVIYAAVAGYKLQKRHAAEDATFVGEHKGWDMFFSPHDRGILALNHEQRRVVVGKVAEYVERPWSDLSAAEVQKNGQSIIQTNRGSQVMGAAIGAALLGPVGLLFGGLSGSKRQKERVNELALKVMIDERTAPVHSVVFFRMKGNGVDAKSRC